LTRQTSLDNLQVMNREEFSLGAKTGFEARYMASLDSFLGLHNSLTDHRESTDITQREVAQTLQISQPAVSNFEGNNSSATMISTLISYAAAVGLEIEFSVKKADHPELPKT
jgi:predicted XRE-type DNA-binding protein